MMKEEHVGLVSGLWKSESSCWVVKIWGRKHSCRLEWPLCPVEDGGRQLCWDCRLLCRNGGGRGSISC
uniref:Uncharacterized protein n=1 Tax=Rhizophora mucronata TaxID=61149 RepID=A0A2P2IIL9_RHIMU